MKRTWLWYLLALAACSESGEPSGAGGTTCPNDLPEACPPGAPTYSEEIAPILQERCVPCHQSGGQAADKPLTEYDGVHKRRGEILHQVFACKMPPAGEPQPTASERAELLAWLVCGAPDG